MNRIKILFIFLIFSSIVFGQTLKLEIDSITISRVILKLKDIHENGEFGGPVVAYHLRFVNNSDSIMTIYPSKSLFYQQFTCNGEKYSVKVLSLSTILFESIEKIDLKSNDSYSLKFSARLLRETNLIRVSPKGYDYSKEMIKILPTLRIEYTDKYNHLLSTNVKSVGLSPIFVYTPKL